MNHKINAIIIWQKDNIHDWYIADIKIDNEYYSALNSAKRFIKYQLPENEKKFIGLKNRITKGKLVLSSKDYKQYLKILKGVN